MTQATSDTATDPIVERTVWTVWPSVARFGWARTLGRLYENRFGIGNVMTVGNFWVLVTIPIQLAAYFLKLGPSWGDVVPGPCVTYRLTNRRVIVERLTLTTPVHLDFVEDRAVTFERFDSIEIVELPGQYWYRAGDLVFREGNVETFRLSGVPSPGAFRQGCLKARNSYVGIRAALQPA